MVCNILWIPNIFVRLRFINVLCDIFIVVDFSASVLNPVMVSKIKTVSIVLCKSRSSGCSFTCKNILWTPDKFGHLWYINVVLDILVLICDVCVCVYIYIYDLLFTRKTKKSGFPECLDTWHSGKAILKKGQGASPSACAFGTRGRLFFLKKQRGLPRVPVHGHSGKRF
jgi:hypothetical protein